MYEVLNLILKVSPSVINYSIIRCKNFERRFHYHQHQFCILSHFNQDLHNFMHDIF